MSAPPAPGAPHPDQPVAASGPGAFPRLAAVVLGVGLVAGAAFVAVTPALGIPADAIGGRYVAACLIAGLVVGALDLVLLRILVGRSVDTLAAQLRRIADGLTEGSGAQPEGPSALAVPPGWTGPFRRAADAVTGLVGALEYERAFRCVVDASGDVVLLLDDGGLVTFASEAVDPVLGRRPAELVGRPLAASVHTADLETALRLIDPAGPPAAGGIRPRIRLRAADGDWRVLEVVASRPPAAPAPWVLLIGRDVTGQVVLERERHEQATLDRITGLPNREALMQAAAELAVDACPDHPLAVMVLGLDRFRTINDSLGHAVGDRLLAEIGPRLRGALRPSDLIARLGGDEFAVLLPNADVLSARTIADRLLAQLEVAFLVDGLELQVDASIGITASHGRQRSQPASGVDDLLREADIGLHRAKQGRDPVVVFDPVRDVADAARLQLASELRVAIARDQLVLHYLPVVDLAAGRLAAAEALVRWQHPARGLVPPNEFLPVAEDTGLILPLSRLVLRAAVAQAAQWWQDGAAIPVAVNLSPRWLQEDAVADLVQAELAMHGLPPELLRLELTETALPEGSDELLARLARLAELGVGLALDDFGTGYTSRSRLAGMPVDELKVDRAFVNAMTVNPDDGVIVRAAAALGQALGLTVVAEGVEDELTLTAVREAGCTYGQGYYWSAPLPAAELWAWQQRHCPARRADEPVAAGRLTRRPASPG